MVSLIGDYDQRYEYKVKEFYKKIQPPPSLDNKELVLDAIRAVYQRRSQLYDDFLLMLDIIHNQMLKNPEYDEEYTDTLMEYLNDLEFEANKWFEANI